ncbi:MAG: hypothetical protein MRZ79_10085 [Bacteroidia bacterium]|nr:hypothetical protein [Bacteroidia bacterium]
MKLSTLLALPILGMLFAFQSCQVTSETETEVVLKPRLLEVNLPEHIKGTFSNSEHSVNYEVVLEKEIYHLTAMIDGKVLEAMVSYEDFSIDFDGHSNTLTAEQMLTLNGAAVKIGESIYDSQPDHSQYSCNDGSHSQQNESDASEFVISEAENTLVRILDYWSNAPAGYVYGERQVTADPGPTERRGNDGVSCIKRGRSYALQYDGSRGNTNVTRTAGYNGGGSYGCMGRCGGNCGRWWIPSSWTLDCFEHDECSLSYGASGGSSDRNCGDEFNEAADDWTFGVIRGCSG